MERRFNPLDPLGIFGVIKRDIDRVAGGKLPPAPGPPGSIGNPIPGEFNGRLVDLKESARKTLIDRGYSPRMVDRALTWYEEWLLGMARRLSPGDPDLQKRVVQSAYEEIAPKAERWLAGIQEAICPN